MTYEQVLSHFENVSRNGDGQATMRCPTHPDRENSLSASRGDDGRTLLHCFVNCPTEAICAARGMKVTDVFPDGSHNGNGNRSRPSDDKPLTLESFAARKGFTVDYLTRHSVHEEGKTLLFPYFLMNGQRAPRTRVRLSLSGAPPPIWGGIKGKPIAAYGLWKLGEARKRGVEDLFLVEGESDSLTMWLHNFCAIGIPGASMCKVLAGAHIAGFHRIFLVREHDQTGGEVFEKGLVGRLAELEYSGRVAVIEMAKAEVKDPNDLHVKLLAEAGAFESEWQALVEQARAVELPGIGIEDFDDALVKPEAVQWLWPNRIPLGKLVLFVGAPGLGKSFASLDIIAHLSDGRSWPDGARNGLVAKSILFSAEDDIYDTIKPRLVAQNAVPGHTRIMGRMREADQSGELIRRSFSLQHDLPHLERMLKKHPDAKLVVIDPVSAYMARVDTYKNAEVRSEVLDPLADMAQRHKITILAITHFNKSAGSGLDRVSGSIAFPAAARAVWGFTTDPEDPTRNLFVWAKGNLAPKMPGIAYRMAPNERGEICLQWIAGSIDEDMSSVQKREQEAQRDSSGSKIEAAKNLWRSMLSDGPRPVVEIENKAREMGISEMTLKRARWDLGVQSKRIGYGKHGQFVASLPILS